MHKHCVIVSGGMDSGTLLYHVVKTLMKPGDDAYVLSFDYNQRHKRELECAKMLAQSLGLEHQIIPLPFLAELTPRSSLTDMSVETPQGHYQAENMKQTVVPGRNTLFLSVALASLQGKLLAHPDHQGTLYYGAHSGDHPIYPDCRPDYVRAMCEAVVVATQGQATLNAPFMYMDKHSILEVGMPLSVPYEHTHTCYEGTSPACGKCGACVERLAAFDKMGVADPIEYADRESWKQFI